MSGRVQHWAYRQHPTTATRMRDGKTTGGNRAPGLKFVLTTLADLADHQGVCWPSHDYLAELVDMSPETVRQHIRALEDQGLLRRLHRYRPGKGQTSNGYQLAVPAPDTGELRTDDPVEIGGVRVVAHHQGPRWPTTRAGGGTPPPLDDPPIDPPIDPLAGARTRAEDPRFAQLLASLAALLAVPRYRRQLERMTKREQQLLADAVTPLLDRGWTPDALARRLARDAHAKIARAVPWLAQIAAGEVWHERSPLELEAARHAEREADQVAADAEAAREVAEQHAAAHNNAADVYLHHARRNVAKGMVRRDGESLEALERQAAELAAAEFGSVAMHGPAMKRATTRHLRALVWRHYGTAASAFLPPGVPPPTTNHPDPTDNGPQRALQAVPAGGTTP